MIVQSPVKGLDEVMKVYGDYRPFLKSDGTVSPGWSKSILSSFKLPAPLKISWGGQVTSVSCHNKIKESLNDAFQQIFADGNWSLIEDYGGCYNFRLKRTSGKASTHSWGIAIDLNVKNNGLGVKPKMDPKLVKYFTDRGYIWGGNWKTPDGMHFQACSGY